MNKLKYYAAFASNEKIGASFVKKLYNFFNKDIERAWNASYLDMCQIEGISEKKIQSFLKIRDNISPDKEKEILDENEISLLTFDDDDYPVLLKEISDAPMWLYYKGNRNLFNLKYNLAVVGSRKCSIYAKNILSKIISEFSDSDLCITSGLALGIDTVAHESALKNNLSTIAVLGSGLQNIYPSQNKKLFMDILAKNGLIVSEYPLNSKPEIYHFPQRNRIVSGLCPATLVAEATLKSGALITARLCLEQNRELMCIPGAISNPGTEGIYKLLKDGAGIVTCGNDILNIMGWNLNKSEIIDSDKKHLTNDENSVLNVLRQDTLTLDEIACKTGLQVDNLMIILTRLEIDDYIVQTEGGSYSAL